MHAFSLPALGVDIFPTSHGRFATLNEAISQRRTSSGTRIAYSSRVFFLFFPTAQLAPPLLCLLLRTRFEYSLEGGGYGFSPFFTALGQHFAHV